jgi:maltose O-acetyltransferase
MPSEKDKMLAGQLYDPLDPELVRDRVRARDLCQALNATREADQEARRPILVELFGAGGQSVWMQPPFFCDYGSNIHLGERVFFNFNCVVLDVCRVTVGDFTLFGPAVQIYTATHPMNAVLRRTQEFGKPVEIGSDVWVGGGAIFCPGVKVGSRSVIGAGSVVTRDVPEGVFAAGNPCRVIRAITEQQGRPGEQDPMEIRPFEEADAEAVMALWTTIFAYIAPHNDPAAVIRHKLAVQRDLFFVASLGGVLVGTVMGGYDGHRGWVYSLAVAPQARRRGIGTALMQHLERELARRGCPKVNLQVLASNPEPVAFYRKLGYAVEERISMGKLLGPPPAG